MTGGNYLSVASGGGTSERPPPENAKIVVEIWCYLAEVYTFGVDSEIQEIFDKMRKSRFSIEILIKKSKGFLKMFRIFFVFGPHAQSYACMLLRFRCPMEIILQLLMIFNFSANFSRFSAKLSRIFIPFPIVLLYRSYSWALW